MKKISFYWGINLIDAAARLAVPIISPAHIHPLGNILVVVGRGVLLVELANKQIQTIASKMGVGSFHREALLDHVGIYGQEQIGSSFQPHHWRNAKVIVADRVSDWSPMKHRGEE